MGWPQVSLHLNVSALDPCESLNEFAMRFQFAPPAHDDSQRQPTPGCKTLKTALMITATSFMAILPVAAAKASELSSSEASTISAMVVTTDHAEIASPSDLKMSASSANVAVTASKEETQVVELQPASEQSRVSTSAANSDPAPRCESLRSESLRCEFPQSEIYELSTRHLPKTFCAINSHNPGFEVNHWTGCQWIRSDLASALGLSDLNSPSVGAEPAIIDDKPTIIYVHGNFMERSNALQRIRILDSHLKRRATSDYRLIALSWPSERAGRPIQDVYANADSSEDHALYIAWLLQKLKRHPRVSLLGFSFGARAVTGGLHLDSGGHISNMSHTPDRDGSIEAGTRYLPYRIGLIAPAIDRNWLTSCGRHNRALDQVSHFVNMYNTSDPALRRFRFVDKYTKPTAGGYAGFNLSSNTPSNTTLGFSRQIQQFDCSYSIGATHDEQTYLGRCPHFNKMMDVLLWNTDPCDEFIEQLVSSK